MFAEWEKQKAIVLIYPHMFCDFSSSLEEVQDCYDSLIAEILKVEDVYLIVNPKDAKSKQHIQEFLESVENDKNTCKIIEIESNDLWARDIIAISVKNDNMQVISKITNAMLGGKAKNDDLGILDKFITHENNNNVAFANFGFNGWGLKYASNLDNQINSKLHKIGILEKMNTYDIVLEGGSIDTNGKGLLLTNTQCLLEKNRNPHLNQKEIEEKLKSYLNISKVLWLNHGFLLGDDTDSHIDTLARFINEDTIVYIKCNDLNNTHFSELNAMERELEMIAREYKLKLLALPFCEYIANDDTKGNINLPASYVNFLFINESTLLVPMYNKPTDLEAMQILKKAMPNYNIIGINCEALIQQHGSLHCISMQIH